MAPTLAPEQYPYTVIGVLEIFFSEDDVLKKWVGSGYLLKTPAYPDRGDIVLTAAHNLAYLRKKGLRGVRFNLYDDPDVYTLAERSNETLRYAIPEGYDKYPGNPAFDFGVMLLNGAPGRSKTPLSLSIIGETLRQDATIAGVVSDRVKAGDVSVYRSAVTAEKRRETPLYYPLDATAPGMSGGPVLIERGSTWTSMGVVTGTGEVDDTLEGIAAPIFSETARIIDSLIATSLAG
ncbi:hypothetical protein JY651_27660 [Pyxidicoccus parkwayensis]|uniref:Serine protease n=1 Tax=Pyxidicoccus parkwayensis TaxID=2813578 RepID=A0ABX7NJV5_9BACT|nr:hypothetical protein [Pyxidicoccus parkwaysis]QSQ19124.1 hypothetical protein JY651_27660 [Pyxidicoccus parkwaysis]